MRVWSGLYFIPTPYPHLASRARYRAGTERATEAELRRACTITPVNLVEEPTHPVSYKPVNTSLHQRREGGATQPEVRAAERQVEVLAHAHARWPMPECARLHPSWLTLFKATP